MSYSCALLEHILFAVFDPAFIPIFGLFVKAYRSYKIEKFKDALVDSKQGLQSSVAQDSGSEANNDDVDEGKCEGAAEEQLLGTVKGKENGENQAYSDVQPQLGEGEGSGNEPSSHSAALDSMEISMRAEVVLMIAISYPQYSERSRSYSYSLASPPSRPSFSIDSSRIYCYRCLIQD